MLDLMIQDFNNFNPESFNMKLNAFRFKFVKKLIIELVLNRIFKLYSCETMFCNKDMVKVALIKRMQLQYLYR